MPTIGIVLTTDGGEVREVLLLLGAVATLIVGSRLQQQAPVVVGAAATAIAAIHFAMTLVGPWLVLVPVGVILLFLGATNENRRRAQERLRGAWSECARSNSIEGTGNAEATVRTAGLAAPSRPHAAAGLKTSGT